MEYLRLHALKQDERQIFALYRAAYSGGMYTRAFGDVRHGHRDERRVVLKEIALYIQNDFCNGKDSLSSLLDTVQNKLNAAQLFFEIGNDQAIFEGLEISKDKELCDQYQGKFPVISVSLKGAKAGNYEDAKAMMKYIMAAESRRLYDRMSGDKLSEKQKEQMKSLMSDNMKDTELMTALWILSSILKEYYGKKVIILIDEYDVPLDKAFENN